MRSEVEVLSWGPDRGNPTSTRQGRGSELTGRSQCGLVVGGGASGGGGLGGAIDVSWSRTRVKRRKASFGWVSWPPAAMPCSCRSRGAYWRRDRGEISASYPGRSAGLRLLAGRPEDEVTEADGPAEVGGSGPPRGG